MTQGKIERWHQTLKNRILLENYFLPGDLEAQIKAFVDHYNHHRYHESINNLTPADVYFGRGSTILAERERINDRPSQTVVCSTSCQRLNQQPMRQSLPSVNSQLSPLTLTTDTGQEWTALDAFRRISMIYWVHGYPHTVENWPFIPLSRRQHRFESGRGRQVQQSFRRLLARLFPNFSRISGSSRTDTIMHLHGRT